MSTSFTDWVEKVYRRVYSGSSEATVTLDDPNGLPHTISDTDTTFSVYGQNTGMRVGVILAVDYELMYVTAWSPSSQTSGSVTVVRGYAGSVAASHTDSLVYIQPRYSRFDVGVALNDELARLSSPGMGLFQVKTQTFTFNPVYMGYDLSQAVSDSFIDIMEVRYKIPYPTRNYPAVKKWKVLRSIPDVGVFPSGQGLVIYEGGYPGQPVFAQYSCAFSQLDPSMWTSNTDVAAATGMTKTMLDIPPLGAEIQLTLPREIRRNFMDVQPDPRRAPEVPAGSVANSVQAMQILYNNRVSEEAERLMRQYTRVEGW